MHKPQFPAVADICLVLEETYPFVRGDRATWVHRLIMRHPEYQFGIVCLGACREDCRDLKYTLPPNVVHFETHALAGYQQTASPPSAGSVRHAGSRARGALSVLLSYFHGPQQPTDDDALWQALASLGNGGSISWAEFLHSGAAWQCIRETYQTRRPGPAFADYYWTLREMFGPLFRLAEIARTVPPARVVHSMSTGYAGVLSALLSRRERVPLVLTDRSAAPDSDSSAGPTITDATAPANDAPRDAMVGLGSLRTLWTRYFDGLGRLTYRRASPVMPWRERARARLTPRDATVADRPASPLPVPRAAAKTPPIVGLVGRLAPEQHSKAFIAAMNEVCRVFPGTQGWLVSTADDDRSYAKECRELVHELGLHHCVRVLNPQNPTEIISKLSVNVVTSIGEAQPLVLLQGFAAGVPAVTADLGPCRDLIDGCDASDRRLGSAGIVVRHAEPSAMADAILCLLRDQAARRHSQRSAQQRAQRYAAAADPLAAYRTVYRLGLGHAL
ncbi:MAG: DUF3492 domain-containing protein [Myxococcales bacterium FL481]|nr:MAG: DUF3492 domain-containing protein [Myxococcales bacterium FL481]